MHERSPLTDDLTEVEDTHLETDAPADAAPGQAATIWVSHMTSIVGGICLAAALLVWFLRPDHYRSVLLLLTIAMFAAILHSYSFENGSRGG